MTSKAKENEMMLARLLNISEDEAATRLEVRATISCADGSNGASFAQLIKEQLERTIDVTMDQQDADIEIVVDGKPRSFSKIKVFIALSSDGVTITDLEDQGSTQFCIHPLKLEIASCYVAAAVLIRLFGIPNSQRGTFQVSFDKIGLSEDLLSRQINLNDSALLGAGAVGNGFLRSARHIDVVGDLVVIDPKSVRNGNLNRCLYFSSEDEGKNKAERLAERAAVDFRKLNITAYPGEFSAYRKKKGRVRRVFVAVDSRRARRSIQGEAPLEVIDASTTEAKEIVSHSHAQPNSGACLSCIYKFVREEGERERDIATGLGITVEDVRMERINPEIASRIVISHPYLDASALVGTAFDTLFKQLCSEDTLTKESGGQALAPFAFVSNLAGALMVIDLLRLEGIHVPADRGNYFVISPWAPPNQRTRKFKGAMDDCEFCSKPANISALKKIWHEVIAGLN